MPILNDKFDESMIILRRRFCWSYTDIFYKRSEVAKGPKYTLLANETARFLSASINLGDKMLYDAISIKWWNQPEIKQSDFWREVIHQ